MKELKKNKSTPENGTLTFLTLCLVVVIYIIISALIIFNIK
jgi:hypothetical protein